ncbi:MAG TPA: hypothetical protein VK466_09945 [Terriglobales bacterium]|nr:hypothetical protein [Terriglobales bacterium]
MTAHRMFNLVVVVALAAVLLLTAQTALSTSTGYRESNEQVQREYVLGERYGVTSRNPDFSEEKMRREYTLGERYGVTPDDEARQEILREYWLGERYGQTP